MPLYVFWVVERVWTIWPRLMSPRPYRTVLCCHESTPAGVSIAQLEHWGHGVTFLWQPVRSVAAAAEQNDIGDTCRKFVGQTGDLCCFLSNLVPNRFSPWDRLWDNNAIGIAILITLRQDWEWRKFRGNRRVLRCRWRTRCDCTH